MYDNGQGVPQDNAEAVRWYRKAAEQSQAAGQNNLGVMYDNGEGVPQDDAEAVQWYRKAAEQGHAEAQNNLGGMYHKGRGGPQDNIQAYMWFNLAATQGVEAAAKTRDLAEARMTADDVSKAQRMARDWLEQHGKVD